eukprot:COSAG01_NODE_2223_length_8136_cov_10.727917_10_plen_189_part_00
MSTRARLHRRPLVIAAILRCWWQAFILDYLGCRKPHPRRRARLSSARSLLAEAPDLLQVLLGLPVATAQPQSSPPHVSRRPTPSGRTTRVRCVSIFLDKNRRYIGKSQSQRPPKRSFSSWQRPASEEDTRPSARWVRRQWSLQLDSRALLGGELAPPEAEQPRRAQRHRGNGRCARRAPGAPFPSSIS